MSIWKSVLCSPHITASTHLPELWVFILEKWAPRGWLIPWWLAERLHSNTENKSPKAGLSPQHSSPLMCEGKTSVTRSVMKVVSWRIEQVVFLWLCGNVDLWLFLREGEGNSSLLRKCCPVRGQPFRVSALVATQRFCKSGLKVLKRVIFSYSFKKNEVGIKKTCNIMHWFYHLTGIQICFFSAQMISIWVEDFRFNFIKDNEHHFESVVSYTSSTSSNRLEWEDVFSATHWHPGGLLAVLPLHLICLNGNFLIFWALSVFSSKESAGQSGTF